MKRAVLALAIVALVCGRASAVLFVSDDFEPYANQAAMDAVWAPSVGAGASLSTDQSVSLTHSALVGTDALRSTRVFDATGVGGTNAQPLVRSFDYYDSNPGVAIARNYAQLWDNSGGLAQLLSLGVYNAVPGESVANHHTYYAAG